MPNARHWSFTLNNPKKHDGPRVIKLLKKICTFLCIGFEYADTGTPHYQGYFRTKLNVSKKWLEQRVTNKWHLEKSIADEEHNVAYCTKASQAPPLIYETEDQGTRNDLYAVYDMIKSGYNIQDIMDYDFALWARNHRAISTAVDLRLQARSREDPPPTVYWLYGPPGTGKTRYVYDKYNWEDIYCVDNSNDWAGYTQQSIIILDEFHEGMITYRKLLRLLDRYPVRLNVKGSSVNLRSPIIYVTCEYHPLAAFSELPPTDNINALIRRITEIIPFKDSDQEDSPLNQSDSEYPTFDGLHP